MTTFRSFLHVGCGPSTKADTVPYLQTEGWSEVRLDIDQAVKPDVVGTVTDMSAVPAGSMHAIFSSHNLEHLYPHEVGIAMREFLRVLVPDGFAVIAVPDLQAASKLVAEGKLLDTAYIGAAGPIAPLDMIFGLRAATQFGNHFMAHHCGFTLEVLIDWLEKAGFRSVAGTARPDFFDLVVVARKDKLTADEICQFTRTVLAP